MANLVVVIMKVPLSAESDRAALAACYSIREYPRTAKYNVSTTTPQKPSRPIHNGQPTEEPDALQWTIRFKQHKTTVLLFVDPGQSFDSIKQDLLNALKKTGRTDLNGEPLPSDTNHVVLGVPVDKNDLSKGWVKLEIPETEVEDGVGGKRKVGGKKSILNASPQGAGLKDGAVLAFRLLKGGDEMDEDGLEVDHGEWDVVIPSYEDEYGSQAEGQGSQ